MSNILLSRPLPIAAITTSGGTNTNGLLSPDPKEVWTSVNVDPGSDAGAVIQADMGQAVAADTFYLGWITNMDAGFVDVFGSNSADFATSVSLGRVQAQPTSVDYRHMLLTSAPATFRYFRFVVHPNRDVASSVTVGVVVVGASFRPTWNYERGSGRTVGDTGTAERMRGGGFAIDQGVTYTGFRWSFGDLQPGEVDPLYNFLRRIGQTKSLIVAEDPDPTPGINERVHWGIFPKLETYERIDPLNTKWAFTIEDWA